MPKYLNNDAQHNKFWEYEYLSPTEVHIKWGRVGLAGDEQTKNFTNQSKAQSFVNRKIREKEKKGYKLVSEEELDQEKKTADDLGHQNKISKLLFVSLDGKTMTELIEYDPTQYVYVEILNSWKKTITRLLLSKSESFEITGGVVERGETMTFGNKRKTSSNFVRGVRNYLKRLAEVVAAAVQVVNFGAMGVRKLFNDEDEDVTPPAEFEELLNNIGSQASSANNQVVSQFACMGVRTLQL